MIKFILASLLCLDLGLALEITETSGAVQFEQGTSDSIFCQADSSLDFCNWEKDEVKCRIAQNEETCADLGNSRGIIEDGKCSLSFDGPIRSDAGTYKCILISGKDIEEGEVNIDVMVPATVEFHDEFAFFDEAVGVELDKTVTVTCDAKGGYPTPELKAYVLDAESNVVRELMETQDMTEMSANDDGTENIKKHFILVPHMDDCGRSIQCVASQNDGSISNFETRELKVIFAPQPIDDEMSFSYSESDEDYPDQTTVSITFQASPAPENNQVIWHHDLGNTDEFQAPPPGSLALQADSASEDGRFQALALESNGHEITAKLLVTSPSDDLLEGVFYLEATNEYGSQQYIFTFNKFDEESEYVTEYEPYLEEEVDTMSGGTIAAIIIVILAIVAGIGTTWWARKNNKWCFAKPDYNPTATAEPDPIIKANKPNVSEAKVEIEKPEKKEVVSNENAV